MSWRMRRGGLAIALSCCVLVLPAQAQFRALRGLSEAEQRSALAALLADPTQPMSEDPSCKADLAKPGSVGVAQALADALARAAAERPRRSVQVDCFVRRGYPREPGQEYCRLAFVPVRRPHDGGFGLLFLMDWRRQAVVAGSVECF